MGLLTQLSCLRCDEWRTTLPDGIITKLTSLEELSIFTGDSVESKRRFVKELGNLRKLRVLKTSFWMIDGTMQMDLVESLRSMLNIQEFESGGGASNPADTNVWEAAGFIRRFELSDINFSRLPSCINPTRLPNLSQLCLHVAAMDEQNLKILGGLPELRYLSLNMKSTLTLSTSVAADVGCFQKLRWCLMPRSMLQFMCNVDSKDILFHIWNGKDAMPFFGSENKDVQKAPPAAAVMVMPSLEDLWFSVHVRALYDADGGCDNLGLEHLASLKHVMVSIRCRGATIGEVKAALRHAMVVHINRPKLLMFVDNEKDAFIYTNTESVYQITSSNPDCSALKKIWATVQYRLAASHLQ